MKTHHTLLNFWLILVFNLQKFQNTKNHLNVAKQFSCRLQDKKGTISKGYDASYMHCISKLNFALCWRTICMIFGEETLWMFGNNVALSYCKNVLFYLTTTWTKNGIIIKIKYYDNLQFFVILEVLVWTYVAL